MHFATLNRAAIGIGTPARPSCSERSPAAVARLWDTLPELSTFSARALGRDPDRPGADTERESV